MLPPTEIFLRAEGMSLPGTRPFHRASVSSHSVGSPTWRRGHHCGKFVLSKPLQSTYGKSHSSRGESSKGPWHEMPASRPCLRQQTRSRQPPRLAGFIRCHFRLLAILSILSDLSRYYVLIGARWKE
jgi:hypothetical protein